MSRKIILIKQELLLLVYELNRSGLLAENEKIRPILAQLEKLLLCDLSDRKSGSAGMPRPSSYAVVCLKKKSDRQDQPAGVVLWRRDARQPQPMEAGSRPRGLQRGHRLPRWRRTGCCDQREPPLRARRGG